MVVEAKVIGDDLRHWKGKIFGPVSNDLDKSFHAGSAAASMPLDEAINQVSRKGKYIDKRLTQLIEGHLL